MAWVQVPRWCRGRRRQASYRAFKPISGNRNYMVNRNLLRQFDLSEEELHQQLHSAFYQEDTGSDVESWLPQEEQQFEVNKIVKGRVLHVIGEDVVVDVGYKSEGVIKLEEWRDDGLDKV